MKDSRFHNHLHQFLLNPFVTKLPLLPNTVSILVNDTTTPPTPTIGSSGYCPDVTPTTNGGKVHGSENVVTMGLAALGLTKVFTGGTTPITDPPASDNDSPVASVADNDPPVTDNDPPVADNDPPVADNDPPAVDSPATTAMAEYVCFIVGAWCDLAGLTLRVLATPTHASPTHMPTHSFCANLE